MRRASFFAAVVVLCLLLSALPASAVTENPYWREKTSAPVETISGDWTQGDNDRSFSLTIGGVNAVGQTTHFEAGWLTPWSHRSLTTSGAYDFQADPANTPRLIVMSRYRTKGDEWSSWFKDRVTPKDGLWGGGAWGSFVISVGGRPPLHQEEWRIVGDVNGLVKLKITADLSLK